MLPVKKFTDFINKHSLCEKSDHLIVAVSGGKDSVLMAHLFKLSGFHFSIAHVNFNLRGEESTRDEVFVRLLAATFEVPFFVKQMDTEQFASTEKISIQMAARILRYNWFNELATEQGCKSIAVAHHQTDVVETMLINLVRGTGINGLHGILPKNERIIRPMLFLTRDEIEGYIDSAHVDFVDDSSNEHSDYTRNKLRLLVIPHLREINPSIEHTFLENAKIFAETEQLVNQAVENFQKHLNVQSNGSDFIPLDVLRNAYPQKLLVYNTLNTYGFSSTIVDQLLTSLENQSGTSFYSHTHRATIDRENLIISPVENTSLIPVSWSKEELTVTFGENKLSMKIESNQSFQFDSTAAYVPLGSLIFPLTVRSWLPGDTFMPLGMTGFKKMSDFFIDNKVADPVKQDIPILVNGNNEIIWVAGYRQDERFKISGSTEKVAIFEWQK